MEPRRSTPRVLRALRLKSERIQSAMRLRWVTRWVWMRWATTSRTRHASHRGRVPLVGAEALESVPELVPLLVDQLPDLGSVGCLQLFSHDAHPDSLAHRF